VDPVQSVEPVGKIVPESFDDQVVVVGHEAEHVDNPVVPFDYVREQAKEEPAVVVVAKDRCPIDSTCSDVVGPVGTDVAREAGHSAPVGSEGAPACLDEPCLWTKSHTFVAVAMSA